MNGNDYRKPIGMVLEKILPQGAPDERGAAFQDDTFRLTTVLQSLGPEAGVVSKTKTKVVNQKNIGVG